MTILYMTFGICLISGAALMLCNQSLYEWRHSEQKAHAEYWKFREYMAKLEIEAEAQKEVISQIKSIDELVSANNRLKRAMQSM